MRVEDICFLVRIDGLRLDAPLAYKGNVSEFANNKTGGNKSNSSNSPASTARKQAQRVSSVANRPSGIGFHSTRRMTAEPQKKQKKQKKPVSYKVSYRAPSAPKAAMRSMRQAGQGALDRARQVLGNVGRTVKQSGERAVAFGRQTASRGRQAATSAMQSGRKTLNRINERRIAGQIAIQQAQSQRQRSIQNERYVRNPVRRFNELRVA